MILFIGQVARAFARARGVPGDRLRPDVRPDGQVGGADRRRRPHPRTDGARVCAGDFGTARPGGARAARRHAARGGGGRGCRALPGRCRRLPMRPTMARLREMLAAAERPLMLLGGSDVDGAGGRRHRRLRRSQPTRDRQHVPPPGPHRQSPSLLRGRPRQSRPIGEARGAGSRSGPRLTVGSRLGEIDQPRLHAVRRAAAPAKPRARAHERGRAGTGVPAEAANQRGDGAVRGRGQGA